MEKVDKRRINIQRNEALKTLGFIINPIAGMGGAVGLKGTDGKTVLKKAIRLGAKPIAQERAKMFLSELAMAKNKIQLIVGAGKMGEDEAQKNAFTYTVIGKRKERTTSKDTIQIAKKVKGMRPDLLIFCGGDGTARDILTAVNLNIPALGVPTGVKMHSAVFAVDPKASARISINFLNRKLPLKEAEVMDVDEEAFRKGLVSAKLYGYLLIPYEPYLIQGVKTTIPRTEGEMRNQAAIAIYIIEKMEPNTMYIIGPGTTTRTIGDLLDTKKTLLGVDLFFNKKLFAKDVNEKQILKSIKGKETRIIVTPIGGQGFIFGRGNQQISPEVIKQVGIKNINVVATKGKIRDLKSLRVDTGDPTLDDTLRKSQIKIIIDYKTEYMMPIE